VFARRRRPTAVAITLAGLVLAALGALASSRTTAGVPLADPYKCVEITDAQGNHVNTTCVPWFLP